MIERTTRSADRGCGAVVREVGHATRSLRRNGEVLARRPRTTTRRGHRPSRSHWGAARAPRREESRLAACRWARCAERARAGEAGTVGRSALWWSRPQPRETGAGSRGRPGDEGRAWGSCEKHLAVGSSCHRGRRPSLEPGRHPLSVPGSWHDTEDGRAQRADRNRRAGRSRRRSSASRQSACDPAARTLEAGAHASHSIS